MNAYSEPGTVETLQAFVEACFAQGQRQGQIRRSLVRELYHVQKQFAMAHPTPVRSWRTFVFARSSFREFRSWRRALIVYQTQVAGLKKNIQLVNADMKFLLWTEVALREKLRQQLVEVS